MSSDEEVVLDRKARAYIVSGGWGAPLYNPKPIWYMAHQNETHHFCLVDVFENGTLHLQAKDNQGNTFDEVTIRKLHPGADFASTPTSPLVNETVTFNASASRDLDGHISSYAWDFDDGTNSTGTDPITTPVYVMAGTYTIRLKVTDDWLTTCSHSLQKKAWALFVRQALLVG